jgi:fructose-1,6-bisphosphatase
MKELNREMTLAEVFEVMDNNNIKDIDNEGLWYDWFCKTSALRNRGIVLLRKLKSIKNSTKFDKNNTYTFFKNNCPCCGPLYDDFRICDKETRDVIFTITPRNTEGLAEVWGKENDFNGPLVEGTWKDIRAFFLA